MRALAQLSRSGFSLRGVAHMVRWRWGAGFGLIVGLALAAPAAALPPQAVYDRCNNNENTFSRDQVIEACTTLLEAPDFPLSGRSSVYAFRGGARYGKQDYAGVIEDTTQSIALRPQEGAYLWRGMAYVALEKYDLAIADFSKSFLLNPTDPVHLVKRGEAKLLKQDYDGAIRDLGMALATDPKAAHANALRAQAYLGKSDVDKALADYTRAVTLDPKDANAFLTRGRIYALMSDHKSAVADFTQVITLAPDFAEGFTERGKSYWVLGERVRAIADHDRAAELDPEDVIKHIARCARRIFADIELETAYAACTRAVEVKAAPEIVYFHGVASLKTERWTEALADFQDGVNRDDQRAGAYFGQGIAKLRLGQREEGEADIARAEELDPKVADTYASYGITP